MAQDENVKFKFSRSIKLTFFNNLKGVLILPPPSPTPKKILIHKNLKKLFEF